MADPDKLTGILVVDKPAGRSSMQMVAAVRRRAGGTRTGHAGTLDPLATGVLVMALGRATRSIDRFMATEKGYRTTIDLSAFTTTDDLEGERTEVEVAQPPSEQAIRRALDSFVGVIQQRPPAFSAMKVGGRRSYALARRGTVVEHPPRPVEIHALILEAYTWPTLTIAVRCGKGTYIRSLARDLGRALGTGGHCATLRRTMVGPFHESMAIPGDALPDRIGREEIIPLDTALEQLAAAGR